MKIIFNKNNDLYSGKFGFLAQLVVMTLACIIAAYLLPGVHINNIWTALLTSIVIALLNSFIRPIFIVLTLPFTILSMGIFLLIINAFIIILASRLVTNFQVDSFWSALLFSLLLTMINYLLEIPNRLMRRPHYPEDEHSQTPDAHIDTDDEGFTPYEEIDND